MRRRRDKLKAAGLRPVQIWVPDTRAPGFAQECSRQSWMIRTAEGQGDPDHDAWSDVTDTSGWTA
ncbi:MAG: antitoxin MazE family protein [Janthinobacterium lividum]